MLTNLQLDDDARWKQRFRAPMVAWSQIAPTNPAHGLTANNSSGKYQLYAWDVPTGKLRQLTERSGGIFFGTLSSDGRWVYYLDDQQGNEIGHYVRIPYEGGEPQDLTPDLPQYSSFHFESSVTGGIIGFSTADADGFHVYSMKMGLDGSTGVPRLLFHSRKAARGPHYSYSGEVAVVATTDRSTMHHPNLLAFDTASGAQISELWDGKGTGLEVMGFSPLPGDLRMAGTTNRSGGVRPLVWNPSTGERIDLELPELRGEVFPVDWSPDATQVLLCHFTEAVQQFYLLSLIHISEPTRPVGISRMPSSA